MTRTYTETETIAAIDTLTGARLVSFVRARIVTPAQSGGHPVFGEGDLARLQLLCDLAEDYGLEDTDTLGMVMSLIDQLNTMRGDMRALMQAVAAQPDEVRGQIHRLVIAARD